MTLRGTIEGAINFTWEEAIKRGDDMPQNQDILKTIVVTASRLEHYRTYLGNRPIIVTSWYRSSRRNQAVRGSRNSRHLQGDAIDFYCLHLSPFKIYQLLDKYHGDRGGLGLYKGHVHVDFRGHKARWKKT